MDISRFVNHEEKNLELEFVSPAFLGNAYQAAELRSAPFKGMLRYWWRILHGAKYGKTIYDQEAKLFGSTEGASSVRMSVFPAGDVNINEQDSPFYGKGRIFSVKGHKLNILDYLAYGKYKYLKLPTCKKRIEP